MSYREWIIALIWGALLLLVAGIGCDKSTDDPAGITAPGRPSPANNSTLVALSVDLSWSPSSSPNGGVEYDVYFGTGDSLHLVVEAGADTTLVVTGLAYNTSYIWRVVARDAQGETASSTWYFDTKTRVIAPLVTGSVDPLDVDDPVWNDIDTYRVGLLCSIAPKVTEATGVFHRSVDLQALLTPTHLHVRLQWFDSSFSVWKDHFEVVDPLPPTFYHDTIYELEDQVFVMIDGAPGGGWDTWNWRALTTGAVDLAEGYRFQAGNLVRDAGIDTVATPNPAHSQTAQPLWAHKDTSEFFGHVLHWADTFKTFHATGGWIDGQRLPGWIVDTASATHLRELSPRQSRWDIDAAFDYDSLGSPAQYQYRLVLSRFLNTQSSDDVNLTDADSVKIKLGVMDNEENISIETNGRGFSDEFWLILGDL